MAVSDQPGVLAQIARSPGDHDVSIAAANQTEANANDQAADSFLRVEG